MSFLTAAFAFVFICNIYCSLALKTGHRRSFLSMVSTTKPADDFRTVLSDVVQVITTTGPRQGLTRSFQIANAVNKLGREFIADQKSFQNDEGVLSLPKTIKRLFEELGATYIKLGQFIASSPTLFPAEFVLEFQSCLDKGPTVSFNTIRDIIQTDLNRPISAVFNYIDPKPLASASVAQVHRAQLKDGTPVVIKVRKPGVDSNLQVDLGFLYVSSRIIEFINPTLSRVSFSNIVGDLRESMLDELDFTREAQNLLKFRDFLDRNAITGATAPKPYLAASNKRVLTMEYLKGVPLVDLEGVKKYTTDTADTLFTAIATWGKSVAELDSFHADLHGGNLLVLEDGRVGFLDFGIGTFLSVFSITLSIPYYLMLTRMILLIR
jgi:aarF domain-containing kinase